MRKFIQILFVLAGLGCVAYYTNTLVLTRLNQSYENWAFERQIAGRKDASVSDYLRERTPLGFLVRGEAGNEATEARSNPTAPSPERAPERENPDQVPTDGILGRVAVPRLNLSAIVREGVDEATLKSAVGHVPSTALPGRPGNFAIAAHRDTLFRALKDIRLGDQVTFESPKGRFTYKVEATKIVKPSDVSVLQADGGQLLQVASGTRILTMITCYPFYYVGSAPKRFIVEATLQEPTAPQIAEAHR